MKSTRGLFLSIACVALLGAACSSNPAPQEVVPTAEVPTASPTLVPTGDVPAEPAQKELSQEDCAAKGGKLVGDIGDGAIHRPEYRCPSGSPPIGRVALGIEGSVCCL